MRRASISRCRWRHRVGPGDGFARSALLAGYRGGWLDMVVMRAVDAVLAFPALVLAMGLAAALGNGLATLIVVIAITQVPTYLRLMRGEILRAREMEYAEAALTVGNPARRILFCICCRTAFRR